MLDMNTIGFFNYMEEEEREQALTRIADRAVFKITNGEISYGTLALLAAEENIRLTESDITKILTKLSNKNLTF